MAKAKKKKYSASDKAILGIGYVLLGDTFQNGR